MDKIAVLIPCYNEAPTIQKVVEDFRKALPEAVVYVYDNNSTDGTAGLAEAAGAVVRREYQQGKGNVIRRMVREVDAQCYLMVDGDDTYPAESARQMADMVLQRKVDMVVGDRLSSTYFQLNKRHFHNFGNRLVRGLINTIFHSSVKDIMTGYRAFSRNFVKFFPVLSKGFEIETEMTIHALDKNFLIEEIPVDYRDRQAGSVSKLNTVSDGIKVLCTIFTLFRDYRPMLFFGIIGTLCELLALGFFIPILHTYFRTGLVPNFPTLIVLIGVSVVGFLLYACGIICEVVVKKHRQLFELLLVNQNCHD